MAEVCCVMLKMPDQLLWWREGGTDYMCMWAWEFAYARGMEYKGRVNEAWEVALRTLPRKRDQGECWMIFSWCLIEWTVVSVECVRLGWLVHADVLVRVYENKDKKVSLLGEDWEVSSPCFPCFPRLWMRAVSDWLRMCMSLPRDLCIIDVIRCTWHTPHDELRIEKFPLGCARPRIDVHANVAGNVWDTERTYVTRKYGFDSVALDGLVCVYLSGMRPEECA